MIFAAIGDIDGHLDALEAAFRHIGEAGILTVAQTGNIVAGGGERGADALALLRERGAVVVQGRRDRQTVQLLRKRAALERALPREEFDALCRAHESLRGGDLEYLRGLPRERRLTVEGLGLYICHGAPASARDVLSADTPRSRLERQREAVPADCIISGGSAEPFHHEVGGTHMVGPGWLCAGPGRARYAVIDSEAAPWRVSFVEVPF